MSRRKISQPSSMEMRIAARKKPKFSPTDEQIEKAGEAARNAYGGNLAYSEVTRWECAAEAALRTLDAPRDSGIPSELIERFALLDSRPTRGERSELVGEMIDACRSAATDLTDTFAAAEDFAGAKFPTTRKEA